MSKYLLYADDEAITFFDTLEKAKRRGLEFGRQGSTVRIESYGAPAPSEAWWFDTGVDAWVKSD